jgi:hypothetical protein
MFVEKNTKEKVGERAKEKKIKERIEERIG